MRRYSLSAALLLACIAGPLSGCAHTGSGGFASSHAQKMEAQFDIARLAESENKLDKSREMYESILKKDPKNPAVYHRLGIVAARQTNYEAAKQYFNQALQLKPADPAILNDLGYACYLSNDFTTAQTTLESVLQIDPQNHRATNNLALVVGSQGRLDESYQLFRRVNKESQAHANVAYLYAQQGEGKKALEHYSRALTMEPDMKNAANAMVEIGRLQQTMEAARSVERTQLAAKQPTPAAVQQVAAAKPTIPQLSQVIADAQAPARQEVARPQVAVVQAAPVVQASPAIQAAPAAQAVPARPATIEVVTATPATVNVSTIPNGSDIAKDAFRFEDDTATQNENEFETDIAKASPAAAPKAIPSVSATPIVTATPTITAKAATPAKAPAALPQSLLNVTDKVNTKIDYVAMCPEASDQLRSVLVGMNSDDISLVKPALHQLGEMADAATPAAPAVRAALKHSDAYVRVHAALALWRIEQNTKETVPVLVGGLQDSEAGVRSFSATAVAMGPKDSALIAPLKGALSDANPYVRLHAAESLYSYPEQQAAASAALLTHLDDKEANVRWLATFILGELLPKSEVAVTALTKALQDDDNRIRAGAAFALGGLGHEAAPALPVLKKLATDKQPEVRKAAQDAVRDIEHQSAQASAR